MRRRLHELRSWIVGWAKSISRRRWAGYLGAPLLIVFGLLVLILLNVANRSLWGQVLYAVVITTAVVWLLGRALCHLLGIPLISVQRSLLWAVVAVVAFPVALAHGTLALLLLFGLPLLWLVIHVVRAHFLGYRGEPPPWIGLIAGLLALSLFVVLTPRVAHSESPPRAAPIVTEEDQAQAELARRVRPVLLFNSSEPRFPLNIGTAISEQLHPGLSHRPGRRTVQGARAGVGRRPRRGLPPRRRRGRAARRRADERHLLPGGPRQEPGLRRLLVVLHQEPESCRVRGVLRARLPAPGPDLPRAPERLGRRHRGARAVRDVRAHPVRPTATAAGRRLRFGTRSTSSWSPTHGSPRSSDCGADGAVPRFNRSCSSRTTATRRTRPRADGFASRSGRSSARGSPRLRTTAASAGRGNADCAACVRRLPLTRDGEPALWNAFGGRWGTQKCILAGSYCDASRAPGAPSKQGRYEDPSEPGPWLCLATTRTTRTRVALRRCEAHADPDLWIPGFRRER